MPFSRPRFKKLLFLFVREKSENCTFIALVVRAVFRF
jgi:hypothetical protein